MAAHHHKADSSSFDHDILKGDVVIGAFVGDEARQAAEIEHNLGFVEALKLYPTAVGWSVFFSLGTYTPFEMLFIARVVEATHSTPKL